MRVARHGHPSLSAASPPILGRVLAGNVPKVLRQLDKKQLEFCLEQFQTNRILREDASSIELAHEEGITILHGANGSGKTTLLRCLSFVSKGDWYALIQQPLESLTISSRGQSHVGGITHWRAYHV